MKKTSDILKPVSATIIAGILFLILLNVASQMYFSPQRINGYLKASLSQKTISPSKLKPDQSTLIGSESNLNYSSSDIKLDFKKAQLSFSGSLNPFFAIKLSDPIIYVMDCKSKYIFKAPYLLIPLSISQAFKKNIRFGYLKAGSASLSIKKNINLCADMKVGEPTAEEFIASLKIENQAFEVFFNKIKSAFKRIDGLRFQKLLISDFRSDSKDKKIGIKNLRISYRKKNQNISSYFELNFQPKDFNIPGVASDKSIKLKVIINLTSSEGLSLHISARHLEGQLELSAKPQKNINAYEVQAKVKDLPLSFLNYISDVKLLNSINAHRVWFNSSLKLKIENFMNSKDRRLSAKFYSFEVYGPVLKAFTSNFEAQFFPQYLLTKPINWRLDYLNLNGLLDQKNLAEARGVIDELGEIRGSGKFQTDGELTFEGTLKNSSFAFSMNRRKSKQVLTKANINLNYTHPKLDLVIENVDLEDGLFDGVINGSLIWDQGLKWSFAIQAATFSLSKKIMELFAIQQTAFSTLKVNIEGYKRNLLTLSSSSQIESLNTKWGEFINSKYLLSYQPETKSYKFDLISKNFKPTLDYFKLESIQSINMLNQFSTSLILSSEGKTFDLRAKNFEVPFIEIQAQGENFNEDFMANLKFNNTNFIIEGGINSRFKIKSVE